MISGTAGSPRAIQSQLETIHEVIDKYLGALDPDHFDVVQDFSGPFPVEVICVILGVPEADRQQIRHWVDEMLHREPGEGDRTTPELDTPDAVGAVS